MGEKEWRLVVCILYMPLGEQNIQIIALGESPIGSQT